MMLFPFVQSGLQTENDNEERQLKILLQIKTERSILDFNLTGNFLDTEKDYESWENKIGLFKNQLELSSPQINLLETTRKGTELIIHFQLKLQPALKLLMPGKTLNKTTHESV
jgi:hypothetical protein